MYGALCHQQPTTALCPHPAAMPLQTVGSCDACHPLLVSCRLMRLKRLPDDTRSPQQTAILHNAYGVDVAHGLRCCVVAMWRRCVQTCTQAGIPAADQSSRHTITMQCVVCPDSISTDCAADQAYIRSTCALSSKQPRYDRLQHSQHYRVHAHLQLPHTRERLERCA